MLSGISKLDLKRINRMQVLRTVWEAGPISRVDLSQMLQITRASITQITNAMIAEGILVEIGEAPYQQKEQDNIKIFDLLQEKGVQAVLFKICVGKRRHERGGISALPQLFGQLPQRRGAHAQDRLRRDIGDQL